MTKNEKQGQFYKKIRKIAKIIKYFPTRVYNNFFSNVKKNPYPKESYQNPGFQLWGHINFKKTLNSKTGKLKIPKNINHIKIDVGTAMNAPNSAIWLDKLPDRIVFGFEPNIKSVQELLSGKNRKRGNSYRYLNLNHINKRFFIFNLAIDDCPPQLKVFYSTSGDGGNSSLHKPYNFKIEEKTYVPCIRLSDFLSLIPWKRFNYIEHLKVDAQGNDLRIIRSAGDYLKKIVFISAECTAEGYEYSHKEEELDQFMKDNNFEIIPGTDKGGNKTYINKEYKDLINTLDYSTEDK
ncbi:FkbM family methyltransferase [Candidatus Pacearchaeota archaeon]|nr:FkbM family methyltransferase [Candidatus Pacearchaeota archaeon]